MIESKKIISLRKASDLSQHTYIWNVPLDLPYFQGHFPGQPILPAVACIDASLEVIRLAMNLEVAPFYRSIKTAKFTGVVQPGDEMKLEASCEQSTWKILWSKMGTQTAEIRLTM